MVLGVELVRLQTKLDFHVGFTSSCISRWHSNEIEARVDINTGHPSHIVNTLQALNLSDLGTLSIVLVLVTSISWKSEAVTVPPNKATETETFRCNQETSASVAALETLIASISFCS
jgi:hypothetical protein